MNEDNVYETPVTSLKRLLEQDKSEDFRIIISVSQEKTLFNNHLTNKKKAKDNLIIYTTINKARVISKKINELYIIDPTINEYYITFPHKLDKDKTITNEQIEKILKSIIQSIDEEIIIPKDQQKLFSFIRYLLGERDERIEKDNEGKINSQDEAISLLYTQYHKESIEYLSGHISQFLQSFQLKNLSYEILIEIIDSYLDENQRKAKDEYEKEVEIQQIFEILENEGERKILMHFLISLNPEELKENMTEYIYNNIDDDIIENELPRIILILKKHLTEIIHHKQIKIKENKTEKEGQNLTFSCKFKGDELDGVFQYLRNKYGDNLESKNMLKLNAGGKKNSMYPISNLIKFNDNDRNQYFYNYFHCIPNENDGWIEFDFMKNKINLSSYTIRTKKNYFPCSWRIVGSNDQKNWELIDRQKNNSILNGSYKQHRFEIENNNNYYRYIRYIQEESWNINPQCKYYIYLTCFEFFGSVCSSDDE